MSLIVRKLKEEEWVPWIGEGYEKASSLMMIKETKTEEVSCRIIRLDPSGTTAMHEHDRVHHVIILDGSALIETDREKINLDPLKAVEVPSKVPHRFVNENNNVAVIQVFNIF